MKKLLGILACLFYATSAISATVEEDVVRYVGIFNGNASLHSDAADTFVWMGLSDTRIFDVIEKRLLADAAAGRIDKVEKNRVARYIRSLGFSGQSKYIPTINQFVTDNVYERYAKTALVELPQYQKWNPIIANRSTFDPKLSDDTNRVINMLRADDFLLKRIAAKRVFYKHQEPETLETLAKELRASYAKATQDNADAIAWMAKALGHTRSEKYRPLLQEVAASAQDPHVAKHANAALEKYGK